MTDLHVTDPEIIHSIPWVSSFLDSSAPHAMDLAHMLHPANLLDLPLDIMRNGYNPQFRTVTVGLSAEFLHHLHELLIVSGDELATPIQTRLSWSRPFGPVRTKVWFLERLPLAQVSQP